MKKSVFPAPVVLAILFLFLRVPEAPAAARAAVPDAPAGVRNIILDFQATDYNPKLAAVIRYFFERVMRPEDMVAIVTPVKSYGFSRNTLQSSTPDQLVDAVVAILKRDLSSAGSGYQDIYNEMIRELRNIKAGQDVKTELNRYRQNQINLDTIRLGGLSKFAKLAESYRDGNQNVICIQFYQQEFIPVPDSQTIDSLRGDRDFQTQIGELFEIRKMDDPKGMDGIVAAFVQAKIRFHFIYIPRDVRNAPDILMM
ncbi:MAG: hypothetical protein ACYDH0_04040 [Candidatus Aminicenantales bacterium]